MRAFVRRVQLQAPEIALSTILYIPPSCIHADEQRQHQKGKCLPQATIPATAKSHAQADEEERRDARQQAAIERDFGQQGTESGAPVDHHLCVTECTYSVC
jgi:hypothetical protein